MPAVTIVRTTFGFLQSSPLLATLLPFQRRFRGTVFHSSIPSPSHYGSIAPPSSSSSECEEENDNSSQNIASKSIARFATDYHAPVMWRECVAALLQTTEDDLDNRHHHQQPSVAEEDGSVQPPQPQQPRIFIDGTLGGGGHSQALLQHLRHGDVVYGCDVDSEALRTAGERLGEYMDDSCPHLPRFVPVAGNFGHLHENPVLQSASLTGRVDGILLDLGVSSHQIDTPSRGFTFQGDGPLDMRMDPASTPLRASDVCNEFDEGQLAQLFWRHSDEPKARKIAKAIVERRPLQTTSDLQAAVASVTPAFCKESRRNGRTATTARVFQALRIAVNREDTVLERALTVMAPTLLKPGGRLVVLSYHSLEDRAAKRVMRDGGVTAAARHRERDVYGNDVTIRPFRPLGKARKASSEEVTVNPRARSAVLRVGERLGHIQKET